MIGKYKIAALCISRICDNDCLDFVTHLSKQLNSIGFRLLVYHTCSDLFWKYPRQKGEALIFELIDFSKVDVLIIFNEKLKDDDVISRLENRAKEADTPVINCCGTGECSVYFDYKTGFEEIVRHVIEFHEIKDVHLIAGIENNDISQEREDVFKKVAAENEIDIEGRISYGDFWSKPAAKIVKDMVKSKNIPQAIICANDVMAIAAANELKAAGYKIPQDVMITGFDGINEIYFCEPKITSCLCNYEAMAKCTVQLISKASQGESIKGDHPIVPKILLSESCGCNNGEKINASDYLNSINNRFYRYREEERSLNERASKIQLAKDIKQAAEQIDNTVIYNMSCLLNEECLDASVNPVDNHKEKVFSDKMIIFFDDEIEKSKIGQKMNLEDILPNFDAIVERGYPLVFTMLNFQDTPIGYVCFFFMNYSADNYVKISQIVTALNNALTGFRNMRYQHYITNQIEQMYKVDLMTGLYNRNGCVKIYESVAAQAKQDGEEMTFALTDLDMLKYVNDNFGHSEGDNAICTAAQALKNSAAPDSICARIGGDEMIAFFTGKRDGYSPEQVKGKIKKYLENYNKNSNKPYKVGSSVGVYTVQSEDITEFEDMIKKADNLMYEDKAYRKGIAR